MYTVGELGVLNFILLVIITILYNDYLIRVLATILLTSEIHLLFKLYFM